MKALRIILLAVASALLFAACERVFFHSEGVTLADVEGNVLIYDNHIYSFDGSVGYDDDDFYIFKAISSSETQGSPFMVKVKMPQSCIGQEFNLMTATAGQLSIEAMWIGGRSFSYELYGGNVYRSLADESYDSTLALSYGTLLTRLDDERILMEMDLGMIDSHTLALRIECPVKEIAYLPFCGAEATL